MLDTSETKRSYGLNRALAFMRGRPRYTYFTALVVVLLVVLIGVFILFFSLRQGTTGAPRLPIIAHGWSLVATLSGTGHQTITGKHIEVGHKYGWTLACTNTTDGWISVRFNGQNEGGGGNICSENLTEPLGPTGDISSPVTFAPIQTIEVTAAASTSWELLLFKGTYYPPLSIPAGWHALGDEIDGTGPETTVGIDVTMPQIWGLLFTCHGTGNIKITLQPGDVSGTPGIAGAQAPCNGRINFDRFDKTDTGKQVDQIQIDTGAENDWQVLLVDPVA